jgi:hypothetical protein
LNRSQIVSEEILARERVRFNKPVNKALPKRPSGTISGLVRFLIVCAILAGVAYLATTFFLVKWRRILGRSADAKVAAIRAAGLPVDWEGLAKWPATVPDSENAAFIYTNAIAHLHHNSLRTFEDVGEILYYNQPVSAKMREQFELAVRTNAAALRIIDQVTDASTSRYPINYLDGPRATLLHLPGLRFLSELLACDAILKIEASNAPAASDDVLSQLNLSRSLDNEPMLISQIVSGVILNISCGTLQEILSRAPFSEAMLSQLQSQFTEVEATNRYLTGLIGERALHNELIRRFQVNPGKIDEIAEETSNEDHQFELPHTPRAGWALSGLFARDRDFYLSAMATNIFLIQQGPPASLAMSSENDRFSDEARNRLDVLSAMLLPMISVVARRDATGRAELRDSIAAIAVERWRPKHDGALPDSLSDLVPKFLPAVPADPFDGKPLHYRKLKKGYCIYSVGPNLRDDGGNEMPPPSARKSNPGWTNYDIVFTVER